MSIRIVANKKECLGAIVANWVGSNAQERIKYAVTHADKFPRGLNLSFCAGPGCGPVLPCAPHPALLERWPLLPQSAPELAELIDLHLAVGEHGFNLQLASHGSNHGLLDVRRPISSEAKARRILDALRHD